MQVEQNTPEDLMTSKIFQRLTFPRFQAQLGRYHVTEICSCLRRSFLERMHGHEETYREIWSKQRGNALHRQLTYAYRGWSELPIQMILSYKDSEVSLVGSIDAYDPDEGWLIEFKSTRAVNWQIQKGLLPQGQHVRQILGNFTIWDRCYNFPVRALFIGYVDDETPPTWINVKPRDVFEWLRIRVITLHNALVRDEAPSAEQNGLCNYCAFSGCCGLRTGSS